MGEHAFLAPIDVLLLRQQRKQLLCRVDHEIHDASHLRGGIAVREDRIGDPVFQGTRRIDAQGEQLHGARIEYTLQELPFVSFDVLRQRIHLAQRAVEKVALFVAVRLFGLPDRESEAMPCAPAQVRRRPRIDAAPGYGAQRKQASVLRVPCDVAPNEFTLQSRRGE